MSRILDFATYLGVGARSNANKYALDNDPGLSRTLQSSSPHANRLQHPVATASLSGRDWTNQELAELYRVESILAQSNVPITTMRGTTDEGDPWFVFCDAHGDVFVHLCRIDGNYVLDGPSLSSVLEGDSFRSLVNQFASVVRAQAPSGNIVALRPGANGTVVRLHPTVMLAALVWCFYLASEHVVGTAHADEVTSDFEHPLGIVPKAETSNLHEARDNTDPPYSGDHTRRSTTHETDRPALHQAEAMRLGLGESMPSMPTIFSASTSIAACLTSIVLGSRFEMDGSANSANGGAATASVAASGVAIAELASATPSNVIQPSDKLDTEAPHGTGAQDWHETDRAGALPIQGIDHASFEFDFEVPPIQDKPEWFGFDEPKPLTRPVMGVTQIAEECSPLEAEPASDAGLSSARGGGADLQALIELATQHVGHAATYEIAGMKVDATFDISSLDRQATQVILSDLSEVDSKPTNPSAASTTASAVDDQGLYIIAEHLPYDSVAKSFVYKFILGSDAIEMIKNDKMVVFVDLNAVDDPSDHPYSVSWITEDQTVVSTIGHAQDFAGYALS